MATFRLSILGRFELVGPDGYIDLNSKKLAGLLGFLACSAPGPQSREALATLLWGSHAEAQARQNLRQALHRLRRSLGPGALAGGSDTVGLSLDHISCDVQRFETLMRDGSPDALKEAVELYRGRLLADISLSTEEAWMDWVEPQRVRLENLALEGLVKLGEVYLARGQADQVLPLAERACAIDPLKESAHRLMIGGLAASGRRADAIQRYDQLVDLLKRELDVEPDPATTALIASVRKAPAQSRGVTPAKASEVRHPARHTEGSPAIVDVSAPVPGFGGRPALAVLPFKSLGMREADEYLADGLTEDLVTGLSNLRWFPVIAWNSMTPFRHSALQPDQVGRALGARYLLSGSMRIANEELRVSTSLVDAGSGVSLWSHRYDSKFSNIFDVQDDITARVVGSLDEQIDQAEQIRSHARRSENLGIWELIRQARWLTHKLTLEDAIEARKLLEVARQRDPDSVDALIELAWWHWWDVFARRERSDGLVAVEQFAQQAIRLDSRDARGHMLLGIAQFMTKRNEQGRDSLREATRLNPSLATAQACIGSAHILAGEARKAIAPIQLGLRLNPHDLRAFHPLNELAIAYYMCGQYEEAQDYAQRSMRLRPGYWYAHVALVGSLARSGELARAGDALHDFLSRRPGFIVENIRWLPFLDSKWHDFLIEGLRLAGFQETRSSGLQ
jgi:TolB-like protein/DNA-binding SARP family transcriptional activator/cytochrome c-type biogenesis protein CcmH/NrfG